MALNPSQPYLRLHAVYLFRPWVNYLFNINWETKLLALYDWCKPDIWKLYNEHCS